MSEMSLENFSIPGYEIVRQVGEGGMGAVFLANQLSLDRQVVIKTTNVKSTSNLEESTRRFDREAELMADVAHPNIVKVLGRGIVDGQPYLVMEYIDGASLRQHLQPGVPMPIEQARPILRSIAQALSCLHEHGILHRDLKPENVLLDAQNQVKVSDFGVAVSATEVGSITQSGQFVGTIDYMAPEQRHRLGIDERADQFSLAVLAYEVLTGHTPLGIFKRPSEKNALLTPEVDAVILCGLENDPNDRYPSVQQFGEMLDRALADVNERRFHWWPYALTAVVAIAILAEGVLSFRTGRAPPKMGSQVNAGKEVSREFEAQKKQPSDQVRPPLAVAPFTADDAREHQERWAEHLKTAVVEEDSIGIRLVLIPPGKFVMGSQELIDSPIKRKKGNGSWHRRFGREIPQHEEEIPRPFWLGMTEVTVGQFRKFIEATKYRSTVSDQGNAWGLKQGKWVQSLEFSWQNLGESTLRDEDPVVNVSFNDAIAFCNWLGEQEQHEYRLPTEAEWEYACRSGTDTEWSLDDGDESLDSYAWYDVDSEDRVHRVARKAPNAFGLFDMHGNVREWCFNWNTRDHLQTSLKNGTVGLTPACRVLRGGAFNDPSNYLRSATRVFRGPVKPRFNNGFRVLRMLPESSS